MEGQSSAIEHGEGLGFREAVNEVTIGRLLRARVGWRLRAFPGWESIRVTDWQRVKRLVLLVGIAYGFVCRVSRKGKRVVKKLVEMARRLRPPKKFVAYVVGKGLAVLWVIGLLKRRSFGFG